MGTLTADRRTAFKIYRSGDDTLKESLKKLFPNVSFSEIITDRVKTWEDVCEEANVDPKDPSYTVGLPHRIALNKIELMTEVLNEGWKPNRRADSQRKWFPWFYFNEPGFRFNVSAYYNGYALAGTGARLCFASRELSDHAAKYFLDLYKQAMDYGD